MELTEQCNGCYEKAHKYGCIYATHPKPTAVKECPCRECLVKVTCANPCQDYHTHHVIYYGRTPVTEDGYEK